MAQVTPHDGTAASREERKPAPPPVELKANELRGKAPLSADELLHFAAAADDGQLLGQERALDAIRLATGIDAPGYNVFVTGLRSRAERESILPCSKLRPLDADAGRLGVSK